MRGKPTLRFSIIGVILTAGIIWSLSLASVAGETATYPENRFVVSPDWLKNHLDDNGLVVVDVRADKYYDGSPIPGAVRLPWSSFRYNDAAANIAEKFIGTQEAQKILGDHGIARSDRIILYDSVERDGGATASYVFWVLDILGHPDMKILDGGIDHWREKGFDVAAESRTLKPILYQAPMDEIRKWKLIDGDFIRDRLGDPLYQIIDVRSPEEYTGEKGTRDLRGNGLKLGHIPTAVNVNYTGAWMDEKSKQLKPYSELQSLYQGLDTRKGVIVYCNSGRRSSFSYFVLRVMGVDQVITYEPSWKEWGNPDNFYPVETAQRKFSGKQMPEPSRMSAESAGKTSSISGNQQNSSASAGGSPKGGYVSCGG